MQSVVVCTRICGEIDFRPIRFGGASRWASLSGVALGLIREDAKQRDCRKRERSLVLRFLNVSPSEIVPFE